MIIIIFFISHWYLSLFSQTFLQHRYASHGAFTMNKFWERFFYIFAYFTQGSTYLSPRTYAIMHRMHHAYADTPKDPHSQKYFSSFFSLMMHTTRMFENIYDKKVEIEERFTRNLPDWPWMDKWGKSLTNRIIFSLLYIGFYIFFDAQLWMYALLPIQIFMSPIQGTIINWFAHKYGRINFKVNNSSKNLIPVDVFMLGEDYHNNHHKFPSSANFGVKWYEIDPVFYIMRVFNWLKIIKIKNMGTYVSSEF